MTKPRLLAAGAAHIDRRGRIAGAYVPAASNPGTMREEVGGGVFNAARNAARHGVETSLMSLRGGDVAAGAVAAAIAEAGIEDLSAVFLDRTTPSYTALLDANGELIAGFADMELYEIGFAKQLRRRKFRDAVETADALLCDANMPQPAVERLVATANGKPLYAIGISPAKVGRLKSSLPALACLFMNAREARVLGDLDMDATPAEAAAKLASLGLRAGVITAGGSPLIGFDEAGRFAVEPPAPRRVADVTGAGDAVAGVTVAMLMRGMTLREAVRHGMAAAALTVEAAAVVADYDDAEFHAALTLVGEARAVA